MKRCYQGSLLGFCILLGTHGWAHAQDLSGPGRIIVGRTLSSLKLAVRVSPPALKIDAADLRTDLAGDRLVALFIPASEVEKPVKHWEMLRCFEESTEVFPVPVSPADRDRVLQYIQHPIHQRIRNLKAALSGSDSAARLNAIQALNSTITSLPTAEQASAKLVVGAELADIRPSDPTLASYVAEYQQNIRDQTKLRLHVPRIAGALTTGEPYGLGGDVFTFEELSVRRPSGVEAFSIGGKDYKAGWFGQTYVVVPQRGGPHIIKHDFTDLGMAYASPPSPFRKIEKIPDISEGVNE